MQKTQRHAVVLVTVPDLKAARKVAQAALVDRLVACANIVPGLESHYWWQGQLESSQELLLVFKTTRDRLEALEDTVQKHHPYDTPEFVVLPIDAGSGRYLDWLDAAVGPR